ncbi:hypothetical protein, partial [Aquabacterium sp. UBA2148]|uniref:hypothetical protein n=1 Tax=Aquabacterium sp. UBA2148 TaxID=1946042 RepID=UPI00257ED448
MTRKPTPHDYLKRDPDDAMREDFVAFSEDLAAPFDPEELPQPDYVVKGLPFWWGATFDAWRRRMLDDAKSRALEHDRLVDARFAVARARYEEGRSHDE